MMKRTALLASSCIFFYGCMLGPKGDIPEPQLPANYSEQPVGLSSQQQVNRTWWESFNDEVLTALINKALSENFDLLLAKEKVRELRANYRMESGQLWPSINAFGSAVRFKRSKNLFGLPLPGSRVQNLYIAGFDASWEIDLFGKIRSAKRAAYFNVLSSEDNVQSLQVSISAEVGRIYTNIRSLQQRIFALQQKIKIEEKLLELTKVLLNSGLSDELSVEEQKNELLQDQSNLPQLISQMKQDVYQLSYLIGITSEEMFTLIKKRENIPIADEKIPLGLPSDLLRNRPDIRSAEKSYYAACAKIGQAKADLFPSISLTSALGFANASANNLFSESSNIWLLWPAIDWNLFKGWQTMANIRVQNSKQKQALISYQQAVSQGLKEVESALVAYAEERGTLQNLKLQLLSQKKVVQLTQGLLDSGLAEEKNVLESQKNFYAYQDSYFQSKERYMADLISVYKALGGGWDDDIIISEKNKLLSSE
jgi:NodT family efflux transporter outer membrane factor (OMF) lipoprotein